VKVGSAVVKIYFTSGSPTVEWYEGTERKRLRRAKVEEAELLAHEIATRIHNGQASADLLTGDDRIAYLNAVEALRPTGVTLSEAVLSFVSAHKQLKNRATLQEATNFFLAQTSHVIVGKSVANAYEGYLQEKMSRTGKRNVESVELHVGKFAKSFNSRPIIEITQRQIDSHIRDERKLSGRYFNNARSQIVTFFGWARTSRFLPEGKTEAEKVAKDSEIQEAVKIFEPEKFQAFLGSLRPDLIPYVALSAFAGLRPSEAARLGWDEINWENDYIEIKASVARKTLRDRFVPLLPGLKTLLRRFQKTNGLVVKWKAPRYLLADEVKKMKEEGALDEWPPDVLRHSFASYRLSILEDKNKLANEMGNSPQVILKNYRRPVSKQEARKWFSILPTCFDL
tara:strand:- start:3560 stop:4750 length:1191 start_codon:yes stop_codon:yes gene_type:complete